jgi:hypothetical protein
MDFADHQYVQTQEIPYKLSDSKSQPAGNQIEQQVLGAPFLPQVEKGSVGTSDD